MNVTEMAKAHIETVKNAVTDLVNQKAKIEAEIKRLVEYVNQCEASVTDFEHVNNSEDSSNVSVEE